MKLTDYMVTSLDGSIHSVLVDEKATVLRLPEVTLALKKAILSHHTKPMTSALGSMMEEEKLSETKPQPFHLRNYGTVLSHFELYCAFSTA